MIGQLEVVGIMFYISALAIKENGQDYTWGEYRWAQDYIAMFQKVLAIDGVREEFEIQKAKCDAETARVKAIPLPPLKGCYVCGGAGCAICRYVPPVTAAPVHGAWFGTTEI